ncbi:MAG: helicase C-terminal domain-containing protein [Pseudomonadota bacterium]|nr:helicase C-terminal domain-containing protein [Pseudomonadota bacterium]
MSALRFTPPAAAALRAEIVEAGGMEVFAVGDVDGKGLVERIEIHARGQEDAVLALRSRPRAGQVVIHNHPSGDLRPSDPDMHLAGTFGEDGVGFVIVDSPVTRSNWIVEPLKKREVPVDLVALERFFREGLPTFLPGWEPRPGQLAMAERVALAFMEGGPVILEAGTGTGKSLGYLVPAALWALANDKKVVVSTYTRTLQAQLVADDLPMLTRGLAALGLPELRTAVLKGRTNYLCRRKLQAALGADGAQDEAIVPIAAWAKTSASGDIADLGFEVPEDVWERVESDTDQTLRARCPHFNTCFYYQARRAAAAAHVVVVNHALLLSDLSVKRQTEGVGILPAFDRVVLDEAHHLEQAATSVSAARVSAVAITRALMPVLGRSRRPGALERLGSRWPKVFAASSEAHQAASAARDLAKIGFETLGDEVSQPFRVRGDPPHAAFFADLGDTLERVAARLGAVQAGLEGEDVKVEDAQPILDLGRARRRLEEAAVNARAFLNDEVDQVRYLDPGKASLAAARAPVDVAPLLRDLLVDRQFATVLTSATLAVNGRIDHYVGRTGLEGAAFETYPSPFDYEEQAILALPKDLPPPDAPGWLDAVADVLVQAIEASRGGAFVLCTSHDAVRTLGDRVEAAIGRRHAVLRQGRGAKGLLLEHFRKDRGAVLFGTDSFWEGVSVRGDGLRLVAIPRLPFRVPTEPIAEARYERIRARGEDPFRVWSLPEAVLKLRQGFGRLIRSGTDRGAVLLLDRRLHEMWYGRVFLSSLPNARRVVGPTRMVMSQLQAFYAGMRDDAPPGSGPPRR